MVIPVHDANPTWRRPIVTLGIILAGVFIYAFVQPHGATATEFLYERAAIPCELTQDGPLTVGELRTGACDSAAAGVDVEIFPDKLVWPAALVSIFLHGSWLHVLGNFLFLWIFGNNLEDRLGHVGYLAFYLIGGVAALAAHVIADPGSTMPVVGASGAIAAVMGAYLVLWPHARITVLVPLLLFFPLPLPAFVVLVVWLAMQFATDPNSSIAWVAHVGGFVFGMAVAWLLIRHIRPRLPEPPRRAG